MKPGAVRLAVADLEGSRAFYERTIGLRPSEPRGEATPLAANGTTVVELVPSPDAPPRPAGTTGLFHLAILVPSRLELARSLRRLVQSGWSLTGASDHLVSEALYLSDPEGNGIEVYRDRPREEWRHANGELQMSTLPLDLQSLAAELGDADEGESGIAAGTRIGHVHLNVANLDEAERFYHAALGLDVTVRGYPGALFVASGGYHHHVGLNTWAGERAPAPPPGSRGLLRFELVADDEAELERVERGLAEAGVVATRVAEGIEAADPSGNRVLLRSG